jgi:hypothetical protein
MTSKQFNLFFSHAVGDRGEIDKLFADHEVSLSFIKDNLVKDGGWVQISVEGDLDEIQRAIAGVTLRGIQVTPVHLRPMTLTDANPTP